MLIIAKTDKPSSLAGTGISENYPLLSSQLKNETKITTLLRAMSIDEWNTLQKNGFKYSYYEYAMEQKWFATSLEHVKKWGMMFYPTGDGVIIKMKVPVKALEFMFYVRSLDNIGPAYSADIEMLNIISRGVERCE